MAVIDISPLPVGLQLRVRRTALQLKQAELGALVGVPIERVCEAEKESRYRSPAALVEMQRRIDEALRRVEAERHGRWLSEHNPRVPGEADAA